MTANDEFLAGYNDGFDPDYPEPSANRSHCYRHSFWVARRELNHQNPVPAWQSRINAAEAERKDENPFFIAEGGQNALGNSTDL